MANAVYLNEVGIVCALGVDVASARSGLFAQAPSGVRKSTAVLPSREFALGLVDGPLADCNVLPPPLRSRNNALLLTALKQIRAGVDAALARYGAHRVAVVLGTSTSGIAEAEEAIAHHQNHGHLPDVFHINQLEMGSPAMALSMLLGLAGPSTVISTACSSSAKSMVSAARMLRGGFCDAAICGGIDSVSGFTLAGFLSLEAISPERCNPLSANRSGINLGDGGALFLMTREPGPVRLAGWGESSDAYHISAPAPDGAGASLAMSAALGVAGIAPNGIDYINLHGTGTPANEAMESRAVAALFGGGTPVSSTKPLTGHALGGAGALEAAFCWLTLHENDDGRLPPHWWDGAADPDLPPLHVVRPGETLGRPLEYAMSNSFAFGGSNAVLVLGRG
jgi:3-oxoacyl-[acyl-carrier-protein] synthase-1